MEENQLAHGAVKLGGYPLSFFAAQLFQTPYIEEASHRYVHLLGVFHSLICLDLMLRVI